VTDEELLDALKPLWPHIAKRSAIASQLTLGVLDHLSGREGAAKHRIEFALEVVDNCRISEATTALEEAGEDERSVWLRGVREPRYEAPAAFTGTEAEAKMNRRIASILINEILPRCKAAGLKLGEDV
jgi:hypothetical protein